MTKDMHYPIEILTADEARALIQACSADCPTGRRNRALIAVLYRSGLRIAEALDLQVKDVDLSLGTIRVLHGKGDVARTVGLDPGTAAILALWLADRRPLGLPGGGHLFCTLKGSQMWHTYVRDMLKRKAVKADIQKRVHPHGMRHTHAAQLASEGVPLNVIQGQLGHSNAATTSRYINHIAPQQVISTIQKREW